MGGSSDTNSFIPKRGPVKRQRRAGSRQIYLFTVISYVLFSATLVASVGVFLYERYIEDQLENEVEALNQQINRYREADLEKVRAFDNRLVYTAERVGVATSLSAFFAALEEATVVTAQISELSMERQGDDTYIVDATIETDSFDASISQREHLERSSVFADVALSDIDIVSESEDSEALGDTIKFSATLGVPLNSVPFVAGLDPLEDEPISIEAVDEIATTTEEDIQDDSLTASSSIETI